MQGNQISLLERREIEAAALVPFIKAMSAEFGPDKALEVAGRAVDEQALEAGRALAEALGGSDLGCFKSALDLFRQGGALEFNLIEAEPDRLSFDVTRCRYAEMYERLGMKEFGYLLSCRRDFALIRGFNPRIMLLRKSTIMEGADCCDFRFQAGGPE